MFVGEEADGRITKFESRDVIFLEEDYPMRGESKSKESESSGSKSMILFVCS